MNEIEIEAYVKEQCARIGIEVPSVYYRNMGCCAGRVYLNSLNVYFNMDWMSIGHPAVCKSIILHELLHIKHYKNTGSRFHDKGFKAMCAQYGCSGLANFHEKEQARIIALSNIPK